jgi:predicted MFS family arabinose efflux permease
VAGYLPNWLGRFTPDLSTSYRYTLYIAGALSLLAVLPSMLIRDESPRQREKISLYPYLWGIDRFTVRVATIELFIGMTMGVVMPFMNVFYLYRLGTSREFFGSVAALAVVPIMIATTLGPAIAARLTDIGAVVAARWLIPVSTLVLAWTVNPYTGTGAYWAYRALFSMSQSIWFAFVMQTAAARGKAAASAWLEITFWIGMAIAAQLTGRLLAEANYAVPFYVATASALVTGVLTYACARTCRALATPGEEPQRV